MRGVETTTQETNNVIYQLQYLHINKYDRPFVGTKFCQDKLVQPDLSIGVYIRDSLWEIRVEFLCFVSDLKLEFKECFLLAKKQILSN